MNALLNVALKDTYESLRTKRLIITLAIFILAGVGMAYWIKSTMIRIYTSGGIPLGTSEGQILSRAMKGSFLSTARLFLAVVSTLLGADAINGEIETGTVRVTLGHPIYRDQFLLGKFLGRAIAVVIGFILFAAVSVGAMMAIGIPFSSDMSLTFIKPLPFFLLFSLVYLSLGALLSTLIKKPSVAIIVAIVLPLFLEIVYPSVVSVALVLSAGTQATSPITLQEITQKIYTLLTIEPGFHLENINNAIFYGITSSEIAQNPGALQFQTQSLSYLEAVGLAWKNIAILVVMFLLPFALAYAKFMRADLR